MTEPGPPPEPAATAPRASFPLGWKIALLATFLATVPLIGVGATLYGINREVLINLNRGTQLLALDDLARTIDQELTQGQDALGVVGALFADPLPQETRLTIIQAQVQGLEALDHVALYDVAGEQLLVIEEEGGAAAPVPELLTEALRQQATAEGVGMGDVVIFEGNPRVLTAEPIRVDERVTGYVVSLLSLEEVQLRVERLAEGHFGGASDSLFVVDRQLRVLAHPDRERAASLASAADEGILEGVTEAMLGPHFSQAGEFSAADGTPMLGSTVGLSRRPWALVAQVPQSVAYASLYRMTFLIGLTILGAMVLAILLGLFVASRISAPLRRLTAFAGDLAGRRFDARVAVNTRDELAILGGAMNRAAGDLAASEERIKKEVAIRTDLGRYVPEALVEQIVRRERDMRLGGTRTTITVLFADVVGFTPLTEQLAPEHVVTILNELFTILTQIVFRHGGTVDKFVGDCVMALWGAPTPQEDHAARAVEAAEDMMAWLETGNARWQQAYGVTIQLAIGVHTGDAVVGNIGSETRMEYTAIGDVVNVAARLEAIARPQQILVTDAVRQAAGEGFDYLDAKVHRLSGRSEPIQLFEVDP